MKTRTKESAIKMKKTIPALPVRNIDTGVIFYENKLGFSCHYKDDSFAKVTRGDSEIHLWAACDNSWKYRSLLLFIRPIWSGAESFLAGTTSCRIEVENIDDLFSEFKKQNVLYGTSTKIEETTWGTREFPALDLHRNLLTFYEPL